MIKRLSFAAAFICFSLFVYSQNRFSNHRESKDVLSSQLPIIIIDTEEEIPDEPKIEAWIKVINNGPGEMNLSTDSATDYEGPVGIEIRGQSSQMFPKKSYAVETRDSLGNDLDISLLGMPAESDWILYAPYTDKSMQRNFISFYMGQQLRNYASRTAYCEIILNDEYIGVYMLMEKIKRSSERVDIAKLKPEDIYGDELTGGYIIKVDKIDWDFIYGTDGWLSVPSPSYPNAMHITFQYYSPKAEELHPIQKNYIRQFITEFENTLTSSDFANPNIGYQKYINTTSFVDQMLLNEISKEVDSYRYSTYFYKEKSTDGGKLFAGPPWDFNLGYSNVDYWEEGTDYRGWNYELVEPVDWSIMFWWKRLMESNYFKNLAYTRWNFLRSNALCNQAIDYQLDSVTALLNTGAQQRNYDRWPILGEYVWPNYNWYGNDYSDEVAFFRNWLFSRLNWIDENLEGQMLFPEAQLSGNFPVIHIDLKEDYFSRTALKPKFFNLKGDTSGLRIDSVIYKNASSISLVFSGKNKELRDISIEIERKVLNSYQNLLTNQLELGIDQHDKILDEIRIHASNGYLYVYCDNPHELDYVAEIYDLTGKRVLYQEIEPASYFQIPTNFKTGIYIVQFRYYQQNLSLKISIP